MDNLTFGVAHTDDIDGCKDRVLSICGKLGLSDGVLELVRQESQHRRWIDVLSHTSKALCMVARALITNPEVLCIHKPTIALDEKVSMQVVRILLEFVQDKGVAVDLKTRHRRRPRTCIMTSSKLTGVEAADEVYCVSHKVGIQHVEKGRVSLGMLQ
eukprot:gnl/TRDRNA2_/TRDRNA2_176012_c0_seq3.p1 gnl/TRDRNA2_/TRDRNA2_176012_c0~~gnl/TRDRNA2_/TRDRNA2_176012_c0_seq3.p1  ORF type:complete len:157 (-),score=26.02 gnl/TRDRNA2_/TRDRNA2_176012_c0_seq3:314-784(-)